MAEVSISINGCSYDIACDNGQEGRIVDLAHYVDEKVQQIARSAGAFNEKHVLALGLLVLADELFEAHEALAKSGRQGRAGAPVAPAVPAVNREEEQAVARSLGDLAKRIQGIAAKVQQVA
jgi:cell division protein ZapA